MQENRNEYKINSPSGTELTVDELASIQKNSHLLIFLMLAVNHCNIISISDI
jgi:hypothetical protein